MGRRPAACARSRVKAGPSQYVSREAALALPVHATFNGATKNAQLVVSHGCKAFDQEKPAWCSPGYWRNAEQAAWDLVGHSKGELFNSTVVPDFYDTALSFTTNGKNPVTYTDPTLQNVLDNPSAGSASGPYGITPFNATGAYLTDDIPGYQFSGDISEDTCPIDNHGNPKDPVA